ncbi:unnamed protein product [marine sediment metagenome]|uniref:Uncharacterized protein n=1 Tax=marine sediment metagenome TaxID=412755 RepID=X1EGE2_9ZZZZ
MAEIKKDIEDIERILKQDNFIDINEKYEKMRIKKTGEEAFWYKAYGVKSLRQIAEMVGRLAEYEIFYPAGSDVTHSTSYRDHVRFHEGMITFEPIRKLEGADSVLQNIIGIALSSYKSILKNYRYGELSHFKKKYIQDWRDGFQNITHVTYSAETTE